KRAYCLKTQPATGETYPKSDLFNKASSLLHFGVFSPQPASKPAAINTRSIALFIYSSFVN
ncbi:hypothetical protein, partial [Klebsiella pneumoniae]|uniref:hypothetical protein n=1 Tax=Klebsiella pneumoniae TaxID=573 RepID=UPI0027304E19